MTNLGIKNDSLKSAVVEKKAAVGFEPTNNGFANRRLRPLGYAAKYQTVLILTIINCFCNQKM